MTLAIPQEKTQVIKEKCLQLLRKNPITIRETASVVGNLMATAPAFTPAALQVRHIQRTLNQALKRSNQNYESEMSLETLARAELH